MEVVIKEEEDKILYTARSHLRVIVETE